MNRISPFALSFALAFASVGCAASVETSIPSGDSSQNEEAGDDDHGRDTKGSAEDTSAASTNESLPAPKLLPEGAVKTVKACTATGSTNITLGSGKITRTTRDATGFHGVGVVGAIDMVVTEGSGFAVQIEADDNLQDLVSVSISPKGNLVVQNTGAYCTNGGIRAVVTMPKIDNAAIDGSGTLEATKLTAASKMTLGVIGSGALVFHGDADALGVLIQGSGTVLLHEGSAKTSKAVVTGSGVVTGKSFAAGAVTKEVDGSGVILL
jgi:hypothetical protein